MEKTIKWILWLAAIGLLLVVGWRFVVVKDASATAPQCISTGPQCGTDIGYKYKEREYDWECPNNFHWWWYNSAWRCEKDGGQWLITEPVKDYENCTSGYEVDPNNEDQCRKGCNTGVVQHDSCDPVGVCPTQCGLEASEVPDGEGGYLKCDATPACPPAEGLCPTACGKLADYVDDGQGGQKYCPATPLCTGDVAAPQCPNGVPATPPANAHVIRNGSSATVNAHIPEGDRANIYFKENDADGWKHAVRDIVVTGKYLSYTINDLNPSLGYTFAVQASSGCAGGELVSVVVDPPANGKTFMFSYFDWMD